MDKKLLITRLQPRFKYLVKMYMEKHGLNQQQMADKVGIQRSHLNALLNGKRPLSAYYLSKFVFNGVVMVNDIYDGKQGSEKELDFWDTAREAENVALLKRIARMRKKGYNIEKILDAFELEK